MLKRTILTLILPVATFGCAGDGDAPGGALPTSGAGLPDPPPEDDAPEPEDDDADTDVDGETDGFGSSSTGDEEAPADHDALDAYILGLGRLDIDAIAKKAPIPCDPNTMDCLDPWTQGDLTCEQTYYSETKHFDSFTAIVPDSPSLWPGAVLRAQDLTSGVLSQIGLERAPGAFSLSLENLNGTPKATMEAPTLSEFREKRNQLLAQGAAGNTAALVNYEFHRIFSRSQFAFKVGADFNWIGVVDVDAMYNFADDSFENKYLIDFTQTYYTADFDTPPRPSDVFAETVGVDDAELFMGEGDPPLYMQSVSYGRRVLFAIESNESLEVMSAAISAAFGDGIAGVDVGQQASDVLNASKITATVLGGDAQAAVQTILGPDQMIEYILEGGNYSADSPGVPIAYKAAYLDSAPARLALTATYPEVACQ